MNDSIEHAELRYPRRWEFRVIGRDTGDLLGAVREVLGSRDHDLAPGHDSAKGTFHSLSVELWVRDQEDRDALFGALRDHAAVVYVL
ncbi:MAG: DUF493 domain-containing protein [Planctomycetes bacterium]|nr:DUF493 domain-containing protein [Planctomycetota bacterium]